MSRINSSRFFTLGFFKLSFNDRTCPSGFSHCASTSPSSCSTYGRSRRRLTKLPPMNSSQALRKFRFVEKKAASWGASVKAVALSDEASLTGCAWTRFAFGNAKTVAKTISPHAFTLRPSMLSLQRVHSRYRAIVSIARKTIETIVLH